MRDNSGYDVNQEDKHRVFIVAANKTLVSDKV